MSDISIFDLANLASTSLAAYGSLDSDQLNKWGQGKISDVKIMEF